MIAIFGRPFSGRLALTRRDQDRGEVGDEHGLQLRGELIDAGIVGLDDARHHRGDRGEDHAGDGEPAIGGQLRGAPAEYLGEQAGEVGVEPAG